ncbi:MAG: radical SAM protein [bacterium]
MLEIAEQFKSGKLNPWKIKGIIYRHNGELKTTASREYIQDLDSLPFPARHLFPPADKYRPVLGSCINRPFAHLISSRGCPYQCGFCDRKVFGNKFRARSPENVVDEIEKLISLHGAREIKFFDDTFTLDKERAYGIFNELEKRKIQIPWSCVTRADCVDKPFLQSMKKTGCWQVVYGIESGDQRMLDIMKKGLTLQQSESAVVLAKDAGLNARATFIIGVPGETMESLNKTIEFAKKLPLDVVNFYACTLYPGNELYKIAKKEGAMLHEDYSQYTPSIDVHKTRLAYVPEGLTEEQLRAAVARGYKEFYLRADYIYRQILAIRSWDDMARYWKAFKIILKL